jgi:Secretion system C-terminal sorting domain
MKVKYTFFAILFFSAFFASAQTPSVSVQLNPSSVCPGQPLQISVVVSGIFPADTFVSDNVFTLLLSDSSGSFAAPDTIAVLQTPNDTTVTVTVPVLPGSNHYQIAVTGSDPLVDGVPASLKVRNLLAPPNVTFTYKTDNLCTGDSVKLSVDSVAHVAYTWYKNDTALANAHPFYLVAKKQAEYTVMFTDTSVAGCSSGSDSVFVSVFAYPPKPTVTETGPTNFCGTGSVTITAHDADTGTVTYQWIDHGDTLPGVTSSTYTVTVSGVYSVIANYHGCSTWPADSIGVNIASVPVVILQLSPDSFCLYGPTVELSGGTPAGGYFTGNYVVGSNQFNQTLAGLGSFKVYYWFTDSIGCTTRDSGTINILDCTAAGITETNNAPAISLYPNPTSSTVAISIGQAGQVNLKVINLMGQTLSTQVFERELHYNLENLCAGTYMLQLTGPDNSWTTVKKLVVE